MSGIKHTINSLGRFDYYDEICIRYINDLESRYDKNPAYTFSKDTRRSAEQLEAEHRSHLWRCFWYVYQQYKGHRKRKYALRKMFRYWFGCPDVWGDRNYDFLNYDLICAWPMFCTSETRSPIGNPIVFPKIKDIMLNNIKALTKAQQKHLREVLSIEKYN